MHNLYPPLKTNQTYRLKVDPPHELYIEESGNPDGIPVLYIHGGPGAGTEQSNRQFFDPNVYRIILFDQRGSGQSTPHADLTSNTTQALISDIEAIRELLKIEQFMLFGGSWGSTLALAYAQTHPECVSAMILRGIFLARNKDLSWTFQEGANRIFPDHFDDFIEFIPEKERDDIVKAYYKRLTSADEVSRMHAAKAWAMWEGQCATLKPSTEVLEHMSDPHLALSLARIECHYFLNNFFLSDTQLLDNIDKIQHIPSIIVHGRYDIVCTIDAAWKLHKAWPGSELLIIRDAGHSATEPGIIDALIHATKEISKRI